MLAALTDEQEKEIEEIRDLEEFHSAKIRALLSLGMLNEREAKELYVAEHTYKQLQKRESDICRLLTPAERRLEELIDVHIMMLKRAGRYQAQLDYVRQQLTEGWPIDIRDPEPSINQIKLEILNGMEQIK